MFKKIDDRFDEISKEHKKDLEVAMIKPIDKEKFAYAQNGIWAMIAPMGAGKTYNYLKLTAMQEALGKNAFYETAVICSTSGEFDVTVQTFRGAIKRTELTIVKDDELLSFLEGYKEKMLLYNTLMKFMSNNLQNPDESMQDIIIKNRLYVRRSVTTGETVIDREKCLRYIASEVNRIGWKNYPHRMLLILDDFASHPLLRRKEDTLSRELKKLRHFMITCIICVQTVKSIPKDIKRNVSDFILFPGISQYDFNDLIRESSAAKFDYKVLWEMYSGLKNKHDMFTIHVTAGNVGITYSSMRE